MEANYFSHSCEFKIDTQPGAAHQHQKDANSEGQMDMARARG